MSRNWGFRTQTIVTLFIIDFMLLWLSSMTQSHLEKDFMLGYIFFRTTVQSGEEGIIFSKQGKHSSSVPWKQRQGAGNGSRTKISKPTHNVGTHPLRFGFLSAFFILLKVARQTRPSVHIYESLEEEHLHFKSADCIIQYLLSDI